MWVDIVVLIFTSIKLEKLNNFPCTCCHLYSLLGGGVSLFSSSAYFKLDYLMFFYWILWLLFIFWILIPYQIYNYKYCLQSIGCISFVDNYVCCATALVWYTPTGLNLLLMLIQSQFRDQCQGPYSLYFLFGVLGFGALDSIP